MIYTLKTTKWLSSNNFLYKCLKFSTTIHCKYTCVKTRSLKSKGFQDCTIKPKYTLKTTLSSLTHDLLKQRGAILVMNHDSIVQMLARNSFQQQYFPFSGFHAHNAIVCGFFVKNGYGKPKLLLTSFLTYVSNIFLNLHQIFDILISNMTRFWESQFSDYIDHHHKSALK